MKSYTYSFAVTVLILTIFGLSFAQGPPGSIRLLPNYKHKRERGIDTSVGSIWKDKGASIKYDIGRLAGNYAQSQKAQGQYYWYKEQVLNGSTVQLLFTKDRTLYVTFPKHTANFYGKLQSDEDLADILLMLATFSP